MVNGKTQEYFYALIRRQVKIFFQAYAILLA